ncbi:hypothetical protein, partial [Faecalimonas umbilicata]|uniref:hypothetical protein n=1 Tax=Faecalimonas umbilicata TaxID=1912855 RepID=UPI0010591B13
MYGSWQQCYSLLQLFVYAAEPKDAKEKERQKEIVQERKQCRKKLGGNGKEKQTEKKDAPSSEEDRKQEEKPDFPLGKDCKGEVIGTAVAGDDTSLYSTPGSMATITPGADHAYGSWGTCEFSIATET